MCSSEMGKINNLNNLQKRIRTWTIKQTNIFCCCESLKLVYFQPWKFQGFVDNNVSHLGHLTVGPSLCFRVKYCN